MQVLDPSFLVPVMDTPALIAILLCAGCLRGGL